VNSCKSPEHLDAAPVPAADADVVMGFKRITPENFICADLSRAFGLADANQWIGWFNEICVGDHVPEPVRRLFELARGSMIYGWLYYPLLSVGFEQCGRCLEAGVRHAAALYFDSPPPDRQKTPYRSLVRRMIAAGHIPKAHEAQWLAAVQLRNAAAHPTTPTIWMPGNARATLGTTADRLNGLFDSVKPAPPPDAQG
jgi:hypothetical protein